MKARAQNPEAILSGIRSSRMPLSDTIFRVVMQMVTTGVVLVVLLIVGFIVRGAFPALTGQITTARDFQILTPEAALELPLSKLATYLGQPESSLQNLDGPTLALLVQLREEELKKLANPESKLNTASLPMLFLPNQWAQYDQPEFIWQPNSEIPKFNVVPLLLGSLRVAIIALLVAVPIALGAESLAF